MGLTARFAYLQARLQVRHGARPDAALWRRLQASADFANYLQLARQSALRPWVVSLHAGQDSNEIEHTLRRQLREHVTEIAGWLPPQWRAAVRWTGRLPDLPALHHLLSGEPAPAWLRDDPQLRGFSSENIAVRLEAMRQSDCRVLAEAWQAGIPLRDAWLRHWQSLWPGDTRELHGMDRLYRLLRQQLQSQQLPGREPGPDRTEVLQRVLVGAFRRYSFLPAAAFAHLALTSLDLARLRGDLLVRALFRISPEQVA